MKKTMVVFGVFCEGFFLYGMAATAIQFSQSNIHLNDFQAVCYPVLNGLIQILNCLLTPIWAVAIVITLSFVYASETKKQARIDAAKVVETCFPCNECGELITFMAGRKGETVDCPHCQEPTILGIEPLRLPSFACEPAVGGESENQVSKPEKKHLPKWAGALIGGTAGGLVLLLYIALVLFLFGLFVIAAVMFATWILKLIGVIRVVG